MNVPSYVLPAGQTVTVTPNLAMHSDGKIDIEGTVLVNPGVSVAFLAKGPLTITGTVGPAASRAVKPKTSATSSGWQFAGSGSSNIGGISLPPGTSMDAVASADGSTLTVGGVTTAPGAKSTLRGKPGDKGGDIEIGTATAIAAEGGGGFIQAVPPDRIVLLGPLTAGAGGKGFSDSIGTDVGTALDGDATDGGAGGSISVAATTSVDFSKAAVTAGNGGAGGGVFIGAESGTAPKQKGMDVIATAGSGGKGGDVTLTPPSTGPMVTVGSPGLEGDTVASAGDGGPGSGDGGSATAHSGALGAQGQANVASNSIAPSPNAAVTLASGKGGASADDLSPGGKGGNITLILSHQGTNLNFHIVGGIGGAGFGACKVTGPDSPGTAGGAGGDVTPNGMKFTVETGACGGGNGGDGAPQGVGGKAGVNLDLVNPQSLGAKPGNDGKLCSSGSGLTTVETVPVPNGCAFVIHHLNLVYMVSNDSGVRTITEWDLTTGALKSLPALPADIKDGINVFVANGPTGRGTQQPLLYVACGNGTIQIIDENTEGVVGTIAAPSGASNFPEALAYNSTTGILYAASSNLVTGYNVHNSNAIVASIAVNGEPKGLAVDSTSNRLFVDTTNGAGGGAVVVDTAQNSILGTFASSDYFGQLGVNTTTGTLYASEPMRNKVLVINPLTLGVIATVPISAPGPTGLAVDSTRNRVFVSSNVPFVAGSVAQIDGATNTVAATVGVGKGPRGIALDTVNDRIYVTNVVDGTMTVLNPH